MGIISRFLVVIGGLLPAIVFGAEPSTPFFPSLDPFYTPKKGSWEELAPGTIIGCRPVHINSLRYGIQSTATAYQLLYVTKDLNSNPAHSVTTIVIPKNAKRDRLLSVQPAYDSPDINCSPSYGLQVGAVGPSLSWNMMDLSFVEPFVRDDGPVLNIPDYEGWNAAFTVGPQTAYHTLDSIRAAFNFKDEIDLQPNARTVLYGFSGGAYATEWASEMQPSYAPELTQIVGAAMGGPPPNITNTYIHCDGGDWAELNVWAVLGMMNAVPEMKEYIDKDLLDEHREEFYGPMKRCSRHFGVEDVPPSLAFRNISSFFKHGDHFLYRFRDTLDHLGVMGRTGAPKFPMYIYQGTKDEIVDPIGVTNQLVRGLCEKGGNVRYVQYPCTNHMNTLIKGGIAVWIWIGNLLSGRPTIPGCRYEDLNPPIDGSDDGCPKDGEEALGMDEYYSDFEFFGRDELK
ncbi:secretory lipase-domain-containing protein [Aspergillus alliaceus]|uniref:secretory lipase-domain-containing protein n=1 Tax=Petromyces alliaceus TaxID=209559 RepID=UPI0012A527AE|nr:secretory lipase-domain-containing protein [Aspergillus alliaceus]KAB8226952.1 secretory lipase-domain-containing protein [Aspergillus alliaceus]